MAKFEIDQRVLVVKTETVEASYVGRKGAIKSKGNLWTWYVLLDGDLHTTGFTESELAPADEAPQRGVAGAGDGSVVTVTSDHGVTSRAVWVKIDGNLHLFVEASAVHEHIRELQTELAQAVAERNAAVAALEPLGRLWVGWERYCDSGDKSYKTITQWIEAMIVPGVVADWLKAAKQAPSATGGAENDDAKSVGVFATGLSALRRSDGSISVYRDLGGGHMIIVDTYDYEKQVKILEKKLASANDLVDQIERNMPQTEEEAHDKVRVGPIAWNAFIAGSIIREYKRREKDVGEVTRSRGR